MAHPKVAIFIMDTPGHFSTQLSLAQDFADLGFETMALINNRAMPEFLELMETKGYELKPRQNSAPKSFRDIFNIPRLGIFSNGNTWNFFSIPGLDPRETGSQQAQLRKLGFRVVWKSISRSYRKSLLIWPEFNFFYGHLRIFREAVKAKVSQSIYPYSLVNEKEWLLALGQEQDRTRHGILNRIMDMAFPEWTRLANGIKIRLPLRFLIQARVVNYLTYNPWLAGANLSIPIFTPDSFTFSYMQKAGYNSDHLHMGGMTGGEILIRTRQSSLNQKRNSKDRKPLVLVALPPDQTSDVSGQEFKTLISSTILEPASLLTEVANVQFVLHPRLETKTKTWLESLGLNMAQGQLPALIARSDLYVACASATLRIAESLGIPAINYDVYNLRYGDFDDATSVRFADKPDRFVSLANDLLQMSSEQPWDRNLMNSPAESIVTFTRDLER